MMNWWIILTERHAEIYIQNCTVIKAKSRMNNWRGVTRKEIHLVPALKILMGITQKPTTKTYFTRDPFQKPTFLLKL
jgi:hypothetical protein